MSRPIKVKKIIKKGKFYHIHEGSPTGHPGMIYWKSDKKNLYLALSTDTSPGSHRSEIIPISKETKRSFVQNRPILAKRKDIGGERTCLKFAKANKSILKVISKHDYRETPSIRRADRRYIKKLKKKPRY